MGIDLYKIVLTNITLSQTVKNKTTTVELENYLTKINDKNQIIDVKFLKRFADYKIVKVEVLKEIGTTKIKD